MIWRRRAEWEMFRLPPFRRWCATGLEFSWRGAQPGARTLKEMFINHVDHQTVV
jgi:hypothetical protein